MTYRKELEMLRERMHEHGAIVRFVIDTDGYIDGVFIVGAKGLREHFRDPLSAAEAMRAWLYDQDMMRDYPERVRLGQVCRNGIWANSTKKENCKWIVSMNYRPLN